MSDIGDEQIKAEIDLIMKGVKTIMQKIEGAIPKTESSPEQNKENQESLGPSNYSNKD
jgi:hypothetical protein